MEINKVLYVEDSTEKYMAISRFLSKQGISDVTWVSNAANAVDKIISADESGKPFDLLLSDMHFDYFGTDDHEAGEKLMLHLHSKGYNIPVVFCSSQNWKIPDSLGTIFYNPYRDWEMESQDLFKKIKKI